jgi:acetyltransferase-like isoleucine patch superfamily enzyme
VTFPQKLHSALRLLNGLLKTSAFERKGRVLAAANASIKANRYAHICLGDRVAFAENCGIAVFGSPERPARLTIGDRTYLQPRVRINCSDCVEIGQDCAIAWDVDILDTDFHTIIDPDGKPRPNHAPIRIGDRVWVGVGAKIPKGVTIGHDAVVAAGAVVTRAVPPRTLVAGSPARIIKQIAGWKP